jgi:hypothetical protein
MGYSILDYQGKYFPWFLQSRVLWAACLKYYLGECNANYECDVLRDEGESYARKLIQAGVTVTATRYRAIHHDFMMLNPVSDTPANRGAIAQVNNTIRKVFAK